MKIEINTERLYTLFETLVKINSPSGQEEYLGSAIRSMLAPIQMKELTDITSDGQATKSMLYHWPAFEQTDRPVLLLSAHLDTVEPTENLQLQDDGDTWRTDGTSILGADDKAGLAAIIELLLTIHENKLPHPAMDILFTEQEEIGLLGSKRIKASALKAQQGLILDSDGAAGIIIHAAPYQINFNAELHGIASHAGTEPEKGKSAILAASQVIQSLPFGRIDHETTLNIGKIQGGKASNIVADLCKLSGEIRSLSKDKLDMLDLYVNNQFRKMEAQGYQIEYTSQLTYHGYYQQHDTPFLQGLKQSAINCGLDPLFKKSGGGSDANILKGLLPHLECVVLSTGMQKVHTHQEHLAKKDLLDTARWLLAFVT